MRYIYVYRIYILYIFFFNFHTCRNQYVSDMHDQYQSTKQSLAFVAWIALSFPNGADSTLRLDAESVEKCIGILAHRPSWLRQTYHQSPAAHMF